MHDVKDTPVISLHGRCVSVSHLLYILLLCRSWRSPFRRVQKGSGKCTTLTRRCEFLPQIRATGLCFRTRRQGKRHTPIGSDLTKEPSNDCKRRTRRRSVTSTASHGGKVLRLLLFPIAHCLVGCVKSERQCTSTFADALRNAARGHAELSAAAHSVVMSGCVGGEGGKGPLAVICASRCVVVVVSAAQLLACARQYTQFVQHDKHWGTIGALSVVDTCVKS